MNVERVEALLQLLHEAEAAEIVVETTGWRVGARKGDLAATLPSSEAVPPPPEHRAPERPALRLQPVTAGLVGIFHADEPPIEQGDLVDAGQPVGGIESMGILNAVLAPVAGEVAHVAIRDGQGVQFGQELMTLLEATQPEAG